MKPSISEAEFETLVAQTALPLSTEPMETDMAALA
jgi:hypothetical protein